jgi:hypothetical protein
MTDTRTCPLGNCTHELVADTICPTHRDQLHRALTGGLTRLYVELNIALRPGRASNDDPGRPPTPQPLKLPISTAARSAQQHLLELVEHTEDRLRHHLGWTDRPLRGREGPRLQGACTVLNDNLDLILALHGPTFAADLLHLIGQARHAAGQTGGHTPNKVPAPCPDCRTWALRRGNGTDLIACAHCATTLTADQLDDLVDPPAYREAA